MPFIVHRPAVEKKIEELYGVQLNPDTEKVVKQKVGSTSSGGSSGGSGGEGGGGVGGGPEFREDPTKTHYWEDQMMLIGYRATVDNFYAMYPEAKDALPCIKELDKAKNKIEQSRMLRAYRAIAKAMARFAERYARYHPSIRAEAVEYLKEDLEDSREVWEPFEC